MKNLSLSLKIFALITLFGAPAFAQVPANQDRIVAASLDHFNVDQNASIAHDVSSGSVSVNLSRKTVTLVLLRTYHCTTAVCPQFMIAPTVIELPLVKKETDTCGGVTYTAKKDLRPVDGSLQELTVNDGHNFSCPSFVRVLPTSVTYSTEAFNRSTGQDVKSDSYFSSENSLTAVLPQY